MTITSSAREYKVCTEYTLINSMERESVQSIPKRSLAAGWHSSQLHLPCLP